MQRFALTTRFSQNFVLTFETIAMDVEDCHWSHRVEIVASFRWLCHLVHVGQATSRWLSPSRPAPMPPLRPFDGWRHYVFQAAAIKAEACYKVVDAFRSATRAKRLRAMPAPIDFIESMPCFTSPATLLLGDTTIRVRA